MDCGELHRQIRVEIERCYQAMPMERAKHIHAKLMEYVNLTPLTDESSELDWMRESTAYAGVTLAEGEAACRLIAEDAELWELAYARGVDRSTLKLRREEKETR